MKREWKKARKEGILKKFYAWAEANNRDTSPTSFVEFEKKELDGKFLDHKKAREEGYYFHLRAQAAAFLASCATVEILKVKTGQSKVVLDVPEEEEVSVRMQRTYVLPGKGATPVDKMSEFELKHLLAEFKKYGQNKILRSYVIAKQVGKLEQTRQSVYAALESFEKQINDLWGKEKAS